MPVRYVSRAPGSTDTTGFESVVVQGPRLVRAVQALREMLRRDVAVLSVHDPELVPLALLARLIGVRVVVDVHEDIPAQILHKDWLATWLRRPLAAMAKGTLRIAERVCVITLAEANYAYLFRQSPVIFQNFPLVSCFPEPQRDGQGIVYVGDVTTARGAKLAILTASQVPNRPTVTLIGRCREPLRTQLVHLAAEYQVQLELEGFQPHRKAMQAATRAAVGISPLLGMPNHKESLPTKVIEYLALGLPVVASDLPGTRRVVGGLPGVCLVPPGDERAWIRALTEVLGDGSWRRAAQDNVADIRRQFTWPEDDVRALYAALLGR